MSLTDRMLCAGLKPWFVGHEGEHFKQSDMLKFRDAEKSYIAALRDKLHTAELLDAQIRHELLKFYRGQQ